MFRIIAKVKGFETTEGNYKNQLIAEKHKRRLEKKYSGTTFKIEQIDKTARKFNNFYPLYKLYEGEEL